MNNYDIKYTPDFAYTPINPNIVMNNIIEEKQETILEDKIELVLQNNDNNIKIKQVKKDKVSIKVKKSNN